MQPANDQSARDTVRSYASDLQAAHHHVLGALKRHADEAAMARIDGGTAFARDAADVMRRTIGTLDARIDALGGKNLEGKAEEAVTHISGFFAGLYGKIRSETASRMLRDDSTALSFLMVASSMLHATATALGDAETAAVARTAMAELPRLIMRANDLVPVAVVVEVSHDVGKPADARAANATIAEVKAVWHATPSQSR